jgi:hypothetical protein
LRTGLLLPIALVVPLFLALTGVLWEGVARREAETLVAQRQGTALAGLNAQLSERRHANETIVYLLSKRDGLGTFIEAANTARLAQTLIVMQASLDLSYISVYSSNGQRLLHVGNSGTEGVDSQLVAAAILGRDRGHAFALGVHHGLFCVGCCWLLMLLMFAVGIGNLGWMLTLGAVMALEKNVRWGKRISTPLGVVLIAAGIAVPFLS